VAKRFLFLNRTGQIVAENFAKYVVDYLDKACQVCATGFGLMQIMC
jgi:hypothetical protein